VKKFKLQVLLTQSIVVAISIFIIAILDFLAFRSESMELNKELLREKNLTLEAKVIEKFASYEDVLASIELKKHTLNQSSLSAENSSQLMALYNVLKNRVNSVYLFDSTGAAYKHNGDKLDKSYKDRSYYNALFKEGKRFYVSSPYTNKSNGISSLQIAYKVNDDVALSATIHLNVFLEDINDSNNLFVYAENGTILVSPNKSSIGQKMLEVQPKFADFSIDSPELSYTEIVDGDSISFTAFWGEMKINGWSYVSFAKDSDINHGAHIQLFYSLLTGLIGFMVTGVVILIVLEKQVLKPVGGAPGDIAALMEKMAMGDLTIKLPESDANTGIYRSLTILSNQLSKIVSDSLNISDSVSSAAQELNVVTSKTLENMEIEKHQVEHVSATIEELSSSSKEVSEKALNAEEETKISLQAVESGKVTLDKNITLAQDINSSVSETALIVDELRDFSNEIGTVTDVIQGISDQTNLLALNAAIEAARAGNAGRGFSVVADEVRALAEKTKESTGSIQEIIIKLQEQSEKASNNMVKNVQLIESSVSLADQVKASFEDISQTISAISKINTLVSTASLNQCNLTSEISKNTSVAYDLVQQNASAINQSLQASTELAKLAQTQKDDLEFFKV